jgi:hypothetical protein
VAQTAGFVAALVAIWSPGARFNGRAMFRISPPPAWGGCARCSIVSSWRRAYTADASQTLKITGEIARRAAADDALAAIVVETETTLEQENGAWTERRSVA